MVESAFCSCATFADTDTLVTGSTDNTVRLWRVIRNDRSREQPVSLQLTHLMRGHTARINCIATSRAWSLIVSGSKDGSAAIWDLNRGAYTRSIWHGSGPSAEIHLVAIYESTVRTPHNQWRVAPDTVAGLHRNLFARSTMASYHQRSAHRFVRPYRCRSIAVISSHHIYCFPRTRLRPYRSHRHRSSRRYNNSTDLEHRQHPGGREGAMGIYYAQDAQSEI